MVELGVATGLRLLGLLKPLVGDHENVPVVPPGHCMVELRFVLLPWQMATEDETCTVGAGFKLIWTWSVAVQPCALVAARVRVVLVLAPKKVVPKLLLGATQLLGFHAKVVPLLVP